MRAIAFKLLVAICALHISGAHWCALQALAWTGMLVSRTQQTTVSEAVRTTFDGDHPCALCQVVQEGQQNEKDHDSARLVETLANPSFIRPPALQLPAPGSTLICFEEHAALGSPRMEPPPIPPPRRG